MSLDSNLHVSGFPRVEYKLGRVICGLNWTGLFYPTLTSLDPPLEPNGDRASPRETYTKEEDGHGGGRWSLLIAPWRRDEEVW